ncbi:MAG TPA: urea ABC transporter permease subunit UrtB [Candidatus Didemnitutus sp.]|nr:urea ABC transporter permease subunit UrtB [Candidatus Didemnitutus sp.]
MARNPFFRLLGCGIAAFLGILAGATASAAESPRAIIVRAILAPTPAQKREIIGSLAGQGDEVIRDLFTNWRQDNLFIYTAPDGIKIPVELTGDKDAQGTQAAVRVDSGAPLTDSAGHSLRLASSSLVAVEHDAALRRSMKAVVDLLDLGSPILAKRLRAIQTLGGSQNPDKLPVLLSRLQGETDGKARLALHQAVALIQLADPNDEVKLKGLETLRELHSSATFDLITAARAKAATASKSAVVAAADAALAAIERHRSFVNFAGTLFRGISAGSILLVVALGLAITFGLMGVINMAHGEMITVGAYATYITQNVFGDGMNFTLPFVKFAIHLPGMHLTGWEYQCYFLASIPAGFISAALVGIALERSIIRFLYRRPLESLLATWGVSLILQQLFKLTFGSNNVNVDSPVYLSSNWTIFDVTLDWNRVFVVGFAAMIVLGVWLVLTRTPLGLLIRCVMQNRTMASCMGVRTERVNMLTFGLGSGLAGLAGVFVTQLGTVGPSMGQEYIVDSFMTVVVGGVGSIFGTVVSAVGIGLADQSLQQILLNPVLGKILVLAAIILFLQWRPTGLFAARSRSLD